MKSSELLKDHWSCENLKEKSRVGVEDMEDEEGGRQQGNEASLGGRFDRSNALGERHAAAC